MSAPQPPPSQISGQQSQPSTQVPYTPGLTYAPSRQHYNTMSIISLLSGALAVFGHIILPGIGGGTLALVAIVTGFIGRGEIKRTGEQGGWMAVVGIVLGVIHLLAIALIIILLILGIFAFGTWALLHH
ncbi:MAG TPA: DUF4190 domain-containing protein [Candidatus Dormibacteraeota bacterium]|nr:DUF4190 domain-containing protein [Candidatus Dormibacteraeota bacterium]